MLDRVADRDQRVPPALIVHWAPTAVILETKDFERWENGDPKDAAVLMKPADSDVLQRWPVSKRVNSSRAPDDDPSLIAIE